MWGFVFIFVFLYWKFGRVENRIIDIQSMQQMPSIHSFPSSSLKIAGVSYFCSFRSAFKHTKDEFAFVPKTQEWHDDPNALEFIMSQWSEMKQFFFFSDEVTTQNTLQMAKEWNQKLEVQPKDIHINTRAEVNLNRINDRINKRMCVLELH